MYNLKIDFWIPSFKYQLVEWLSNHYSIDKSNKVISWAKYSKKELLAIYINYRKNILKR